MFAYSSTARLGLNPVPAIAFHLLLAIVLVVPAAALAARSDWSAADESQLRLLLTVPKDGTIGGGIEILLEPDWYTYWRNPGESGVPPIFDFAGSENVASVEVLYPAPVRYDDGTSVSLIYRDEVVFPLKVTPAEPGLAVTLRVAARFGVCSAVCIPTGASSEVRLDPEPTPDPLSAARVQAFERRVPGPPEPGRLDIESATAVADALLIDVRMPESSYSDLFADPPEGWYVGQPSYVERAGGVTRFRLSLAGRPEGAMLAGQAFRFVAVAGGEAVEESITIK
jgi:DsbC/DsbD-like thiol-disulfide interchange protein